MILFTVSTPRGLGGRVGSLAPRGGTGRARTLAIATEIARAAHGLPGSGRRAVLARRAARVVEHARAGLVDGAPHRLDLRSRRAAGARRAGARRRGARVGLGLGVARPRSGARAARGGPRGCRTSPRRRHRRSAAARARPRAARARPCDGARRRRPAPPARTPAAAAAPPSTHTPARLAMLVLLVSLVGIQGSQVARARLGYHGPRVSTRKPTYLLLGRGAPVLPGVVVPALSAHAEIDSTGPPETEGGTLQEQHPYEVMVVLDPEADEARQEDVIARIRQIVEAAGGQLEAADALGRQRLAYEILKRSEAFRWVVTLTAPACRGRGSRSRAAHPRRRAAAHDRPSHRPLDAAPSRRPCPSRDGAAPSS